jgi:hypothetical protein
VSRILQPKAGTKLLYFYDTSSRKAYVMLPFNIKRG